MMRSIILLVSFTAPLFAQGRLRPPANLPCDRNQLTSYTGRPSDYQRDRNGVRVTINTDENTVEKVEVKLQSSEAIERFFLWRAEPFRAEHWKELEAAEGKLKPGIRVTAWVCSGGAQPILDWQGPPQ